jgi:hypothetical protein
MSIAAEAFAEEQAIDGTDIKILLYRFGCYLETLGTQPVTIPISHLVDDMLETFTLAGMKASEIHTFAWLDPVSCKLRLRISSVLASAFFTRMAACLLWKLLSASPITRA